MQESYDYSGVCRRRYNMGRFLSCYIHSARRTLRSRPEVFTKANQPPRERLRRLVPSRRLGSPGIRSICDQFTALPIRTSRFTSMSILMQAAQDGIRSISRDGGHGNTDTEQGLYSTKFTSGIRLRLRALHKVSSVGRSGKSVWRFVSSRPMRKHCSRHDMPRTDRL